MKSSYNKMEKLTAEMYTDIKGDAAFQVGISSIGPGQRKRCANESLTEIVSNLPTRLQSRSPSASATGPACVGRVVLHTGWSCSACLHLQQ